MRPSHSPATVQALYGSGNPDSLYCWNGNTGTRAWRVRVPAVGSGRLSQPVIGDINHDNYNQVVVASASVEQWTDCSYTVLQRGGLFVFNGRIGTRSRSSNRTCGSPASGFRTRSHAFAHGRWCVSAGRRTSPRASYRCSSGYRE
jgi:outer membrane protein assembly factor BamB